MKKTTYFLQLIIALFLFGCSEDFLDIPPEDSLSKAIFFESQADFEQAINATYAPLRDLQQAGGNAPGSAWGMGELTSDNTYYKFNPNFRAVQDGEGLADHYPNNANATIGAKYVTNYLIIARANQILDLIDDVEFEDQALQSNIKGQALFLRGLSYFDLVQFYGAVPLHTVPVTSRENAALPLSSADEVYAQIVNDVSEAISLLPPKSSQEAGRATRGSARMLLGNVYVVQENWSAASTVLGELINSGEYALLPDYANVFDLANKNSSESIFEVQFLEGTEGFASFFQYNQIPMPLTAEQVAAISGVPNSQALNNQGFNIPTPDIINSYEDGDPRKSVSIDSVNVDGVFYPYINKFWQPHSTPGLTGVNFPIYRYSEALLFYAEALNEAGQSSEAITFLNQVRERVGLAPLAGLDQTALRQAIMDERRVELAFENKRWLDLVRTGTAQAVMTAFGERVKANPQDYYFPDGIAPPPVAFTTISELFPIPAGETLLNPNF
ncbi:MAG: RagB/SusD family nutrient uptake outer membrane protein [Allomuricauda sp.]